MSPEERCWHCRVRHLKRHHKSQEESGKRMERTPTDVFYKMMCISSRSAVAQLLENVTSLVM